MKAKQFIYTSWKNGNSPSKGFMVYSMSAGISADDSAAIQTALKYLPPAGLPYAPTPEQIETMFPRGCAFFRLPSGMYCLGQSTYIGRDYSGRQGNYIIHAFVFDQKPDFNAFDYIGSPIFKTGLTDEEANADSNPPPLPEVEVPAQAQPVDNASLSAFFNNPERLQILKYLVAAVLEGIRTNKTVYIYDDPSPLVYWFEGVAKCLPAAVLDKVTFSTYSISKSNSFVLQALKPGGVVNYRTAMLAGDLVYSIKEKIINNKVTVGKYVENVANALARSVDSARAEAAKIDAYLALAGNDPDYALTLNSFFNADLAAFASSEELMSVAERVLANGGDKTSVTSVLAAFERARNFDVLENARFYGYMYENDISSREYVLSGYLAAVEACGATDPSLFDSRYTEFCGKMVFPAQDILTYITGKHGSLRGYLSANRSNEFVKYFVARMCAEALPAGDVKVVEAYFLDRLQAKILKPVRELNAITKQKTGSALLDRVVIDDLASPNGALNIRDYDYVLSVLDEISPQDCNRGVIILIKNCGSDPVFKNKFLAYSNKKNLDINGLAALSGNDPAVQNFIDDMFAYTFADRPHTEADLKKYYANVYSKGKDTNGTFLKALEEYFDSLKHNYERLAEQALAWNAYFGAYSMPGRDGARAYDIICSVFGGAHTGDLMDLYKGRNKGLIADIDNFAEKYRSTAGEYPAAYKVVDLGNKLHQALGVRNENAIFDEVCRLLANNMLLADDNGNKVIARVYTDEIFDLYCRMVTKRPDEVDNVLDYAFAPLARAAGYVGVNNPFIQDMAKKFASKINFKEAADYLIYLVNRTDLNEIKTFLGVYFTELGGGKTKKLAKQLSGNNKLKSQAKAYLDFSVKNKVWKN